MRSGVSHEKGPRTRTAQGRNPPINKEQEVSGGEGGGFNKSVSQKSQIPHPCDGRRLVINQDVQSKILIRIRVHDQDNQLVENYGYEELDLDARLSDADFDPAHSDYRF